MNILQSPASRLIAIVGLLLALAVSTLVLGSYALHIMSMVGIAVILALGLNLLMGYAGQVSLANAAFFGIGAYIVAILGNRYGVPYWVALPLAAFATAGVGFVVGQPLPGPGYLGFCLDGAGGADRLVVHDRWLARL